MAWVQLRRHQARARRQLKRAMGQMVQQLKKDWGVPLEEGTLSDEVHRQSTEGLQQAVQSVAKFRVQLEKAHMSAAETSMQFQQTQQSVPMVHPPWKAAGPSQVPTISGQERPRVPLLSPHSYNIFSAPPPPKAAPLSPPPPPPLMEVGPAGPPPIPHKARPQQLPKGPVFKTPPSGPRSPPPPPHGL